MTRPQAAYLRAVRHHAAKINPRAQVDAVKAMRLYEAWVKPAAAAAQLAAPQLGEPRA